MTEADRPAPGLAAEPPRAPLWARALAVVALVCGLLAVPIVGVSARAERADVSGEAAIFALGLGVAAIVFGHLAGWRIKRASGRPSVPARTGLVLGYVMVVLAGPIVVRSQSGLAQPGEASWVSDLRALNSACTVYNEQFGRFPAKLADLGSARLIDPPLASGSRRGYRYEYAATASKPGGPLDEYTIRAIPLDDAARRRYGFTDSTGTLSSALGEPATGKSPPL